MSFLIRPCKHFQKAKVGNAQAILKRLEDYLKDNESTPIQILCGFWKDQQEAITYQEIREAVVAGALTIETWNDWSKDYSVLVQNKLRYVWEDAMKAGSVSQPVLSALEGFTFDLSKQNIINWIQHHGAEFVTVVTQEQKGAISALLARSVREKHSIDELAKFIRPCIGLTEPQAKANLRYYENMVANLKEQHPRMKSDSVQKKAREAAAKYAEKQHRYRAMTIAQTEMATAYNRGADEAIRQAQAQKLMGTVIKRWCTSGDDMVCDQCRALEGLELAMDDKFQMGSGWNAGENLTPPAHPRCGCAIEYIEVEPPVVTAIETETFEVPTGENTQDYKEVVLDDNTETYKKGDTNITAREVLSSSNHIYVSEAVKTKRKQIHQIDTGLSKTLKKMDIVNADNLPTFLVVSAAEMRSGVLASYNAYKNIMYINEYAGSRKTLLASQESFAESDNDISTYIHELIHWLDAEFYRMKHYGMIDKKYEKWINKQCKKRIEKLVKSGYNINEISEYASDSFIKEKFDEVYTEYRVSQILGR